MFEKSGFLQAGFYDNYNRCKQAEHAHSAPLTWLLVFLINEGCMLIWFLSILQLRLNQLAKTLQKKETKFDMVNMVLESQYTRVLYSLPIAMTQQQWRKQSPSQVIVLLALVRFLGRLGRVSTSSPGHFLKALGERLGRWWWKWRFKPDHPFQMRPTRSGKRFIVK